MSDPAGLAAVCRSLDQRGYASYRKLEGAWALGDGITLFLDRVAPDPFAPPSRVRLRVEAGVAGFPDELLATRLRRVVLGDFLARRIEHATGESAGPRPTWREGSGHSGRIQVDAGRQEVLERTVVRFGHTDGESGGGFVEARLEVGLPAAGRSILGNQAAGLLTKKLPRIAREALVFGNLPVGTAEAFIEDIENQEHLRAALPEHRLIAFVADGAILPRKHGASELPLGDEEADGVVVPFESPPSLRVRLPLLHPEASEDGGEAADITGMGIPEGVTLIVGGGFHGKSTLLQALARAVVPHIPGDGRSRVVTRADAVTIRAEEGRAVNAVDVSPFIRELPGGKATDAFTTDNASGSTSQAAAIVEAIEAGSRLLLMDEDTSATNLMIRDARMAALVSRDAEPIVALLDRVRELWTRHGVSTVLVMGGSGDYFEAADTVIQLDEYRPREVTNEARRVAEEYPMRRASEAGEASFGRRERVPVASSFDPAGKRVRMRIQSAERDVLRYGKETLDLRAVTQLFDASQTRAAGNAVALASSDLAELPVPALLDAVEERLDRDELDSLSPEGRAGEHPGRFARPRRHEIAAVLNRLRNGRFTSRPVDGEAPETPAPETGRIHASPPDRSPEP